MEITSILRFLEQLDYKKGSDKSEPFYYTVSVDFCFETEYLDL